MITIVSGLPRSGTSLMMQMLEKGGMDILTDGHRKPDENNTRGYFEVEKVKTLQKDNSWLNEAEGKAVKIIVQLLPFVSPDFDYSVIYMIRPVEEILRSQTRIISNLYKEKKTLAPEILEKTFAKQVRRVQQWMEAHPRIQTLYIFYPEVLHHPLNQARTIQQFLGLELDVKSMASAVDASMWHQKSNE